MTVLIFQIIEKYSPDLIIIRNHGLDNSCIVVYLCNGHCQLFDISATTTTTTATTSTTTATTTTATAATTATAVTAATTTTSWWQWQWCWICLGNCERCDHNQLGWRIYISIKWHRHWPSNYGWVMFVSKNDKRVLIKWDQNWNNTNILDPGSFRRGP